MGMANQIESGQNHITGRGYPMGAISVKNGIQYTAHFLFRNSLKLIIFDEKGEVIDHINMKDHEVSSGIYSCIRTGPSGYSYCYEADGIVVSDPFMKNSTAKRRYADKDSLPDRPRVYTNGFDWEDDKLCHIPFNEIISYQLHVRGFTAHSSSKVTHRGTFAGVTEKIPHLLDLGINQIVLMPCYEFDEVIRPRKPLKMDQIDYRTDPDSGKCRINFWGFTEGQYYMPKAAYSDGDPVNEFKAMVKALHRAGIEVIMRFYFPDSVNKSYIPDILRFWAFEYHVDGFFLMGSDIPMDMIAANDYLCDCRIYNVFFDKDSITGRKYGYNRNMAFVNSDFMNTCRRFLKSDENQLSDFLYRQRLNPSDVHTVNYITDYYGFTLNDLVTYDYKHNEANMEDNSDGENFNYSWNCGVEGPSRKKSVINLRAKQMKNALVFLIFAQGVPMICAGDELANTQNGNNNPYCQDNETGWVVWKETAFSREIYDFLKKIITIRNAHPILHPEREFRIMDYASCGFPDLSYHGDNAWNPKYDNHLRHIGVMICGKYARLTRTCEDDFFFFAYNMHWEDHTFALPKLPKGLKWSVGLTTCDERSCAVVHKSLEDGVSVTVPDRCTVLLQSVSDGSTDKTAKINEKEGK